MTRIYWWLVDKVSRMLEPDERDAVRGDFAESGETAGQALRDVLGLVARRQAALWKDWRPWLALVGLVVPLGVVLSLVSWRFAHGSAVYVWMYLNNWTMAYLGSAGSRRDLVHYSAVFFMASLTLICWSWTSGFVLGSLSRRTIQVNGALFCLVLLFAELLGTPQFHNDAPVFSLTFYSVMFPLIVQTALVLLPLLWGMQQGRRLATLPGLLQKILILWAAAIATTTALAIQKGFWVWMQSPVGWQIRPQPLAVIGPLGCMIVTASWQRWRGKTASD